MSSRVFQGVIHQMGEIINRTIGVIDETSTIVACSDLSKVGENIEDAADFLTNTTVFTVGGNSCKSFGNKLHPDYIAFAQGTDAEAVKVVNILAISLSNIKQYYDEKFDRGNFIKNVMLDNVLPGDIYIKSRELRFKPDSARTCILIKLLNKSEISIYEVIKNLFPDTNKDFVINLNETDIVIVKEVRADIDNKDLEELAKSIRDTLSGEFFTQSTIGIGTIVFGIRDIARSFKEAKMAIEVGKVFDTDKMIIRYDNLGIARLIYQLPTTLCDMFLREVFKRGSIEMLDQETLFTIQRFFENNLNVSETSRKLFVHRNTLVYRLEKIKKITGLDLREFEDAIVFKVAMMVKKYMAANTDRF